MDNVLIAGPVNYQDGLGLRAKSQLASLVYDGSNLFIKDVNGDIIITVARSDVKSIVRSGRGITLNRISQPASILMSFGEKKKFLLYWLTAFMGAKAEAEGLGVDQMIAQINADIL